jgi:asparaginyl-tRNA synthetase
MTAKKNNYNWEKIKLEKKFLPRIKAANELACNALLKDSKNNIGKEVILCGWIYNKRSSGKILFIQFRDGTGDIQAIVEKKNVSKETWKAAEELTTESSLQLTGKIREDERSPFGFEMDVTDIKIIQIAPEYPIGKKEHGPDFLMDHRHLWLRSPKQRANLKIRDEIFFSLQKFLREEGFIRIDTPIFQPVSCEDTTELFSVDYFGEKTYLTQSGQLYCEAAEMALARTYDFGPVFRAEKSKTRKHLIEFWMMDAELPFTDLDGLMDFEEAMMKRLIQDNLDNCAKELGVLGRDVKKLEKYVKGTFERITHKEAITELNKKFGLKLSLVDDFGAPEEAKLAELHELPVFIYDWPAEIKAFYMSRFKDTDMERVRAVDLMAPEGFGELCGGSERIFDYNEMLKILKKQGYDYKDYEWYLDLRKYGTIPHCGFGIGLERTVQFISGTRHIREVIPFARMLNRMYP